MNRKDTTSKILDPYYGILSAIHSENALLTLSFLKKCIWLVYTLLYTICNITQKSWQKRCGMCHLGEGSTVPLGTSPVATKMTRNHVGKVEATALDSNLTRPRTSGGSRSSRSSAPRTRSGLRSGPRRLQRDQRQPEEARRAGSRPKHREVPQKLSTYVRHS